MTEDVKDQQSNDELELASLKLRADQMGLKYHHKTGLPKLKALVNGALKANTPDPTPSTPKTKDELKAPQAPFIAPSDVVTPGKPRKGSKADVGRLVRIRINCMNPDKTEWEGQIFNVSNSKFGFKKYVPFNNDEGWHVPFMIYTHIKNRKCQIFKNSIDGRGNKTRQGLLIHEFAVELMDPLTSNEMQELAQRQAMASGTAG